MTLTEIAICLVIGGFAGVLGGLAGIGGSMIMLPALAIFVGDPDPGTAHHMFMAAAMVVNVVVSFPAAMRHRKAGAIHYGALRVILPAMAIAIVVGVLVSNAFDGLILRKILAGFIAAYALMTIYRFFRKSQEPELDAKGVHPVRLTMIGLATGMVAGLLGIGGGVLMVPMLQVFCKMPIKNAIATSSAVMVLTAIIGASIKLGTLGPEHGRSVVDALIIAAALSPTAFFGGRLGAALTHKLPLQAVRLVVSVALLIVAARMAADAWSKRQDAQQDKPIEAPQALEGVPTDEG
ncbi:MAG: sulfite exporter TauE/SafE family protein [Phycisphaerales bacterium JB064]